MKEFLLGLDYWKVVVEWASILSLIISAAVLVQSVSIKNKTNSIIDSMVNKARIPEIMKDLEELSLRMSKAVSMKNQAVVEECVVEISSLSSILQSKLSKKNNFGLEELATEAGMYLHLRSANSNPDGRQVYLKLRYVIKNVDQHIKDERLK